MKEEKHDMSVTYRGKAQRLEVDTPVAMIEFNFGKNGISEGSHFAQPGQDLRELTTDTRQQAFKLAHGWLKEARENNPAI